MTSKKVVVLLLSLVLLFGFTSLTFAKKAGTNTELKVNSVKNGHFKVTSSVQGVDAKESRELTKKAMKAKLTKQELINRSAKRNALTSGKEIIPIITEVPGGSDIHSAWEEGFDYEEDFNTFTKVDLSADSAGNDWMWFDYTPYWGEEDGRPANSAFAPEPGGDFGVPDVVAKDEAIEIKVGVPKMSEGGDPYRVSNLILEMYFGEPDVDDQFWVEFLEPAKWHVTADDDPVWTMHSDQIYETEGAPGYDDLMVEDLVTVPFTVPAGATLSFVHAIDSEDDWDGANVKVSADGGETWQVIVPNEGYHTEDLFSFKLHGALNAGLTDDDIDYGVASDYDQPGFTGHHGWDTVTFDLSAYEGQEIMIKWQFTADRYTTNDDGGWWIDDIVVANGETVFENHGEDDGNLVAMRQGPGFMGQPWVALGGWAGYGGDGVDANIDITNNVIGAPGDSFTVRFRAIFDDNDEGDGSDPNWGFEVSNAALEVYTRFAHDIGVSAVDLDSAFTNGTGVYVGETYDPRVTVANFGLNDYTIYNTFVKIENIFGTTVYERYIYTYAPGQGDTLAMYPGTQDFAEGMEFYDFPNWTPEFEGNYTLTAYTVVFGGDDMASDDSLVVDFHVFSNQPAILEDFNTMTDAELYAEWGYEGTENSFFIGDIFGEGDTEATILEWGSAGAINEMLKTPVLDLSSSTDTYLTLEHWYRVAEASPGSKFQILVSTDGGATFPNVVAEFFDDSVTPSSARYGIHSYNISALVDGEASVCIGFLDVLEGAGLRHFLTIDDVAVYSAPDMQAPDAPANLAAVSGDMSASLTWEAVETAAFYSVWQAEYDELDSAAVVTDVNATSAVITGLTNGTDYYFWVTAADYNANNSDPAGSVMASPADVTAPTQITDLHASDMPGENAKMITWTAPAETAPEEGVTYDIRYNYMPVTDATWDMAYQLDDVPEVAAAGTEQSMVVPVDRMHDYVFDVYFAIKTTDSDGNVSAISNPAHADDIIPGMVSDLSVAEVTETSVTLAWTAVGDDGVIAGGPAWAYEIRVAYGEFDAETFDWETAAVLPGVPDPQAPAENETFTATEFVYPANSMMTFALIVIDWNGNESMVSNLAVSEIWDDNINSVEEESTIPTEYLLSQNYPNPFNPTTAISFELPKAAHVKLEVYSTTGQKINTLIDGQYSAGSHNIHWNATDNRGMKVASGIYFYRLETADFTNIKKMTLMK